MPERHGERSDHALLHGLCAGYTSRRSRLDLVSRGCAAFLEELLRWLVASNRLEYIVPQDVSRPIFQTEVDTIVVNLDGALESTGAARQVDPLHFVVHLGSVPFTDASGAWSSTGTRGWTALASKQTATSAASWRRSSACSCPLTGRVAAASPRAYPDHMHVWVSNRHLLVVAESAEGAEREHRREAAASGEKYPWLHEKTEAWRPLDDGERLTIFDPDPVTRTAGEWARLTGPGFLAIAPADVDIVILENLRGRRWLVEHDTDATT